LLGLYSVRNPGTHQFVYPRVSRLTGSIQTQPKSDGSPGIWVAVRVFLVPAYPSDAYTNAWYRHTPRVPESHGPHPCFRALRGSPLHAALSHLGLAMLCLRNIATRCGSSIYSPSSLALR
jgi:hypothetical protein